MEIVRSAMEKLGDDAQGVLIRLLLLSPFYEAANTISKTQLERNRAKTTGRLHVALLRPLRQNRRS
jgi:hypothetical protein